MYASQLLRILKTFPANTNNEICDFDTDELKEAMKESPRRYTNPFLSDEENEKVNVWNNQELQQSNIADDLYTDKNVMDCELPELLVCYKDGCFNVKDICIDDGILHGESKFLDSVINEKIDTDLPLPEPSNDHINYERNSDESCGTQEVINDKTIDTEIPFQDLPNSIYKDSDDDGRNELKNVSKDDREDENGVSENPPEKLKLSTEAESDTVSKATENSGLEISVQNDEEQTNSRDDLSELKSLPSLKSLLESVDQQHCQSRVEEISKRPTFSNEITIEPDGAPKVHDVGPDNVAVVDPVQRGEGEPSFSVAGPVSGLITYSGPIAVSGSISIRSDSSTTSTRSFAFPILQNEWNSSPVRMAKGDQRRLQKHRGWRHGILCCRF